MSVSWLFPDAANPLSRATLSDLTVGAQRAADVMLFHTSDGGEVQIENGMFVMGDGLFNAFYLSMFGGNADDSGLDSDLARQWWGNTGERTPSRKYRSQTQYLLHSIPAVPYNLRRIEDAVVADTQWLLDEKVVDLISPLATIPGLDRVGILINVEIRGNRFGFNVKEDWRVAA